MNTLLGLIVYMVLGACIFVVFGVVDYVVRSLSDSNADGDGGGEE